ncbi:thioredoxin [Candidatus Gromoviella agglomerans]|uniref:thioredoxin n=1 Tax=Candidatus Gromoviella agglomerans TaxID=2806609 RepID=UPI001E4D298B|nr:thioredoxin [Candidatus Gromoviella agglomerans]UFX98421.1 Thioredoxin family protein [Candidatus Gromoviella agglomerans]
MVTIGNRDDFSALVLNSTNVVVVDFFADWCGPCRTLAPIIDKLSEIDAIKVYKVNIDSMPEVATDFGVMSIPTVILFNAGKEVDRKVGVHSFDVFSKWIESFKG